MVMSILKIGQIMQGVAINTHIKSIKKAPDFCLNQGHASYVILLQSAVNIFFVKSIYGVVSSIKYFFFKSAFVDFGIKRWEKLNVFYRIFFIIRVAVFKVKILFGNFILNSSKVIVVVFIYLFKIEVNYGAVKEEYCVVTLLTDWVTKPLVNISIKAVYPLAYIAGRYCVSSCGEGGKVNFK